MQIKICGIRRVEDARAAVVAGASAIGLNFVPESPRFVGSLEAARNLIELSNERKTIRWAGVFVNPTQDQVSEAASFLKLDIVQLHGDEDTEFIAAVRKSLPNQTQVWKAVRVGSADDLKNVADCECDAWLVDSKVVGVRGGSGHVFDWKLLNNFRRDKPLVLSGGLHPGNVGDALRQVRPEWFDVASGVESSPGIKDAMLMERFVRAAKYADQQGG
jgi:phosphoribosylanthranilate isomerase